MNKSESKLASADSQEREAFEQWAKFVGFDVAHTYDTERSMHIWLSQMTADLWNAWQARADLAQNHFPDAAKMVAAPANPKGDHDFSIDLVERVRKACSSMGIATSESLEECSFKLDQMLYALCRSIEEWHKSIAEHRQPALTDERTPNEVHRLALLQGAWQALCEVACGGIVNGKKGLFVSEDALIAFGSILAAAQGEKK